MKKDLILKLMFLCVSAICCLDVSAQFPLKIPKIGKSKPEQPKPAEQPTTGQQNGGGDSSPNSSKKSGGDVSHMAKPRPTSVAVLLKASFEVKPYRGTTYWKFPSARDYSSWIPLINFNLFYDESETVRYTVEWLNPNGSLWFSEPVDGTETRYSSEVFDTKSADAAGTFGFQLLNTKTKEVVFQGKFNVKKMLLIPGDPRQKNNATFYVDNDWMLPVGYVGFNDNSGWDKDPQPIVYMWFKGDLKREDFEARLFHNNQQIASTDDGGSVYDGDDTRNSNNCFQQTEICGYRLWQFSWKNFKVESFDQSATMANYVRDPNGFYTKDKPSEYTVKVFHKGTQVRETKFTAQPNGWLAPNAFAQQIPMKNYRAVIPVKIMGMLDKWNPAAWKTEAFYGNPISGFVAQ